MTGRAIGNGGPLSGEVLAGTVEVDLPGVTHGLVVGPDDVLVLRVPYTLDPVQLRAHQEHIESVLGRDRYLILCGDWDLAKVHRPRGDRREIEPS